MLCILQKVFTFATLNDTIESYRIAERSSGRMAKDPADMV